MAAFNRAHACKVLFTEGDCSGCGSIDSGKQVEDRGLSRSVRTDQSDDFVFVDFDVEVAYGGKSAEYHAKVLTSEDIAHFSASFAVSAASGFFFLKRMRSMMFSMLLPMEKSYVPISPLGLKSIMRTSASE